MTGAKPKKTQGRKVQDNVSCFMEPQQIREPGQNNNGLAQLHHTDNAFIIPRNQQCQREVVFRGLTQVNNGHIKVNKITGQIPELKGMREQQKQELNRCKRSKRDTQPADIRELDTDITSLCLSLKGWICAPYL